MAFTTKVTDKIARIPGEYSLAHYFSTAVEADSARYSLTVPKGMAMSVDARGMTQDISAHDDLITYRWAYSNLSPKPDAPALVSDPDQQPHFSASTFHDYDAFAHRIANLTLPRASVTPAVQAQANLLTAGISDPKDKARAIYNWINQHVRYIAIELGTGGYIPHEAEWTLINAFGDCKDQATLFATMLKAEDIPAELILINAGNRFTLTRTPTLGDFNHMIVWLPTLHVYSDTTAPGIEFGTLPISDYGKPVIHLVQKGAAQHSTPVVPPGLLSSTFHVHAVMDGKSRFTVDSAVTATGPWAIQLRKLASDSQTIGPTTAAAAILKFRGYPNAVGSLVTPLSTQTINYSLNGTFHNDGLGADGNVFGVTDGLRVLGRAGDGPMGPLDSRLARAVETPCYSARQTEDIIVDLPTGERLERLPPDVHVKTANLSYDAHWSMDGNRVAVMRQFVSEIDRPLCTGGIRTDATMALEKIRADYAAPTRLAPHG